MSATNIENKAAIRFLLSAKMPYHRRELYFAELMARHSIFSIPLKRNFLSTEIPSKDDIAGIMKSSPVYKVGGKKGEDADTFNRWTSMVCGWCISIIDEDKF